MDKRVDNLTTVLDLNDAILHYYRLLADLEKNNQLDSKKYKDICEVIRLGKQRVINRLWEYPLNDEYMNNSLETFGKLAKVNDSFLDYVTYFRANGCRRLLEYVEECCLYFHLRENLPKLDGELIINGKSYSLEDGIDELEEDEYDQEEVQEYLDTLKINQQYDRIWDDYELASNQLEANIFIKYLNEAIKNETDERIKNMLIDIKYNIISTISCLEDSFLSNHKLNNSIDHYHYKLDFLFKRNRELYPDYLDYHENCITDCQNKLIRRDKRKYTIEEKVFDIIVGLSIKTHLSCIPDQDLREEIVNSNSEAIKSTRSSLDKKVLKKSIQLNKNYVINNNYR